MTDKELIAILDKILARKTGYNNTYPYNCAYYDGYWQTYDCYCLVKSIAWSNGTCADFWRAGQYAIYNPSSGVGDWTGQQILDHCTDVSTDMSNIQDGEFVLYDGEGHAGIYYGNRKVCECTPAWIGGVFLTDIGSNGERSYNGSYYGRWGWHGKLPFIEYSQPQTFKVGDIVTIVQGAKVYGTDVYFASWVYGTPLVITQIVGDRVVVCDDEYVIGAVSSKDLLPYEEVEDPPVEEPFHPAPYDPPEEQPPEEDPPEDEEHIPFFTRLIKGLLQAIVDFFKEILG